MYRVVATYNGVNYEIYNPLDPSAQIYDDEIAEEMGSTPAFSFTVPPGNIAETVIQPLATHITAYQGNVEVFSGRVISADWDLYNTMTVQCIGDMGDLADSQIAPFSHTGTAAQFLSAVISKHNALVDASRAFTVGTVNVTGETGERTVEDYTDALTLITNYCSGAYGGYIRVRPGRVVDWMDDFGENSQTIRFGENILDLSRQIDAADVATVLIALGPEPEEGTRQVVTAQNADGVRKWGKIYRVEEFESDAGLQAAAQARVDALATLPESAELTALDLSVVDVSIPALTLGAWTNFYSPANGIQGRYLLYKRSLHMTAPANDTVSFGPVQQTITGTSLADKAEAKADNDALKDEVTSETQDMINSAMEGQDGKFSEINQTIDQIELRVGNAEGDISSLTVKADQIVSQVEDAEDNISRVEQTADKINWVVQSGTSASNFTLTSKMASLVADQVKIQTDNLQISGIKYDTTCYVQCGQNEVSIWSSNWGANIEIGAPSGSITLNGDTTLLSPLSVMVDEYGSISSDCLIDCYGVIRARRKLETDIIKRRSASVGVTFENAISVGANSWDETAEGYVYCAKVVESSDARLKQDVEGMDQDTCLAFIMSLRPVSFRFIYSPNVTEYGFIAQEVRQSEIDIGMEDGVVVETGKRYGEYENTLSMKYDNLIAPIVKVIQMQQAEIKALKEAVGGDQLLKIAASSESQEVQAGLTAAGYTEGNPLVSSRKLTPDGDAVLTLNYTDLIAPLVKVVQELAARVEALEGSKDNG